MSNDLAIPDPRTMPVPAGWWIEIAKPAVDEMKWPELDVLESALREIESWLVSTFGDTTEYRKALRCLERRRGELLGPKHQGKALVPRVEEADASPQTRGRWRQITEHWNDLLAQYLLEANQPQQVTQGQLLRLIKEHTPAAPDANVSDFENGPIQLWHGDFRERLTALEPGSVDLIITDPPYPKEDLPLYSDLAQVAAKILGPRGILFCWTGQIFLPEVLTRLGEHLNYGWTFALTLPGSGSRIMGRHIIQAWKPVVAFTPKTWPSGVWGDDLLTSPARDKAKYEWQQNAAPAMRLIERYSATNGLVVDPFMGVGSFALAAKAAGRRFVGTELDAKRFGQAQERVA